MGNNDYTQNLPVPLGIDNLPIPLPDTAPIHEVALAFYPDWSNLASQCHIRSLALDPIRQDLWLATGGGILRWWSGLERFTRYGSEHGLPGNSVKSVMVDGSGQPWAAHIDNGLSYLDGDTWCSYSFLSDTHINCFSLDNTGQLWIGTETGIYSVTTPNEEPKLVELPLHSTPPRDLAITAPDDIWLCTAQGVFHLEESWKRYNPLPSILTIARQGNNLWIGTLSELIRLDLPTGKPYPIGRARGEVSALMATENGIWAACGKQVGFATETSWNLIKGRACDRVTSLAPAGEDSVWIATHSGLQFANESTNRFQLTEAPPDVVGVQTPNQAPNTFSNLIQALTVQHLNTAILWVGTVRGLFRIDLSTNIWRRLGTLGKQDIRAVDVSESDDKLWVSSWLKGIYAQQQSKTTPFPEVSGPVTTLLTSPESDCWAGGLAGIYKYDGTAWQIDVSVKKLPDAAWVRALALSINCLWIGTSVGLLTFNPDTKIVAPVSGPLGSTHIQSLLTLPTNEIAPLWVGTEHGLYYGHPDKGLQPFASLKNRVIISLVSDTKSNQIWVGTDRGLFMLQQTNGIWDIQETFTVDNSGLAHNRITALTVDTSKDGKTSLWIGTPCGLSTYIYESG